MFISSLRYWAVISVLCGFVGGTAFGEESKFTKEQAVSEFHKLLDSEAVSSKDVAPGLEAWSKKVEESGVNLGEEGYMLSISEYILAGESDELVDGRAKAVKRLADFVEQNGKLPESAKKYSLFFSNTLPQAASEAIEAGEYERAEKLLFASTDISDRPEPIYGYLGMQLLETEQPKGHDLLMRFLAEALESEKLSTDQKLNILTYIYDNRQERLVQKDNQKKLDSFVTFAGTDLDGKKVSVENYKGKVLLVEFWASWCMPCIQEMPNVVAAYNKFKNQGFDVLGVSLDPAGSEDKVREKMEDLGMGWRVIYDGKYWQSGPAVENKIQSIPAVFLLDRTGKARYTGLHGEQLHQAIEQLLAEKPAANESSAAEDDSKS